MSTAGLNNVFFVESGLLEKSAKGRYLPTDAVMEFQRKHSFDPQQAGAVLKPVLTRTWYADVVRQRLLFGPADVDDLVKVLADDAGADASFKSQLESLIDWLALADVIAVAADRQVRIVGDEARVTVSTETTPAVPPVARLLASDDADVAGASPIPRTSRPLGEQPPANHSSEPPVLSLAFDLDYRHRIWPASQPNKSGRFRRVGQIAAIRATLGDSVNLSRNAKGGDLYGQLQPKRTAPVQDRDARSGRRRVRGPIRNDLVSRRPSDVSPLYRAEGRSSPSAPDQGSLTVSQIRVARAATCATHPA